MTKRIWVSIVATLLLIYSSGCVSQKLDDELMNMREQVVSHERLYSMALNKFGDDFAKLAEQKHVFQQYQIDIEGDNWVEEHTKDGIVQATTDEFDAMLAKRDERLKDLRESRAKTESLVSVFRQMVSDKTALAVAIYGKEAEAQKAKESLAASIDSAAKVLGGIAGAAAVAIPLMAP